METVSSAPTMKQRRKFELIETSNMNNQDTSSVNHASDVYAIGKLSKCVHGEVQTLEDCCKESIKKCFLQKENENRRKLSDPISHSSVQENHPKMNKTLLYAIATIPLIVNIVGFPITYAMCLQASHAKSSIIYISDTAQDYPEASIAAQSINMIAIFVCPTLLMRHLVLNQYLRDCGQERIKKSWVNLTFWAAIFISLSIQITGNFPAVNVGYVSLHFGAVMIFFVSTLGYIILQTKITYHTTDVLCDRRIYYLRFTITIIIIISAFAATVPGMIAWLQFNGEDYRNWQPNDGGWICHAISVIGEWVYTLFANIYVFSLTYEFRSMTFHMPVIKIRYLAVKEKMES